MIYLWSGYLCMYECSLKCIYFGLSLVRFRACHFKRLINESALKFNESALKNLLLNLTNLPLKI